MSRLHLSRQQSRILAASAIAAFFLLGIAFLKANQVTQPLPKPIDHTLQQSLDSSPTPAVASNSGSSAQSDAPSAFTLNDFERSETKDGKKVWEVKAKHGHYLPQQNQAVVEDATLWMYRDQNQTIRLETKHANLTLEGQKLVRADAYDGVKVVQNDEVTLVTDKATYEQAQGTLQAPGHVTITSELYTVSGDGLEGNTISRDFRLINNVQTSIYPQKKNNEKKNNGKQNIK